MVLILSLVRHGQTHYNAQHRLQGWCDSPLTPQGLGGVRTTAAFLSDRPFTAAYVSPAGRAQATAREIMASHPSAPLPLFTDPDLREFGFGDLEARPEADLLERYDPTSCSLTCSTGRSPASPVAKPDPSSWLGWVRPSPGSRPPTGRATCWS